MRTVITGGAGFVARALAARMNALGEAGDIVLVDRVPPPAAPGCVCVEADLGSVAHMAQAIDGADRVIHLAALPGGASEKHPAQSRAINLDMSLNLLEAMTRSSHPVRLVYTSSIAVFGAPLPDHIDDTTIPRPSMTYGTHKLMVEAALTDAVRRGANAIALRLPGIVARPAGAVGVRSGFMSDIFHAIGARRPYEIPVQPTATLWLLSSTACADALLYAASSVFPTDSPPVVTLPALRVSIQALVAAIGAATARDTTQITYRPDATLTAQFGRLPPLATPAADALGFASDGTIERLVARALSSLDS